MLSLLRRFALMCLLSILLAACGGGGGGDPGNAGGTPVATGPGTPPPPPVTSPLPTTNSITLQSDPGDPIGQGASYQYTSATARISVTAKGNRLVVQVEGDEQWTGAFQTGGNATELKAGEYTALPIYRDSMDASEAGLTWWGNGHTCTSSTGWMSIDNVTYANGQLLAIALRFQRNCNGSTAALHGTINYNVNDRTTGTSPASPPADLWRPPASITASLGNYAYFESAPGDYVGLGKTYLYDRRSAAISAAGSAINLVIQVIGDDAWSAEIRESTSTQSRLATGYYPDVKGSRFDNPVKGGMSWTAAGRGCSQSRGWFMVDAAEFDTSGTLTRLDLRFEQHCEGRDAPLRGAIHYSQPPQASGPPASSSVGSWRAPASVLQASDNFLYLESDANEPLAHGMTDLQTSRNAAFDVSTDGNSVQVLGEGNRAWGIRFQVPARYTQIVPGNYDGVTSSPGDTASLGSLYVSDDSYGCSTQKGWVVVDNATYVAGKLVALELRFEQLCTGDPSQLGLLHGHLRWRADVPDAFPGPATPPDLFWQPAITLPAGSYIYTTSDPSDFLASGDFLFTPLNSTIGITESNGKLDISLYGDTHWNGSFQTMSNAGAILPGYYAGLDNTFRPARGSFTWSGNGHGCNTAVSGVVVDRAVYTAGKLSELQLRFEQHCGDEPGAMRGQIHWLASDTRQPAGPVTSVPASLWKAPTGALPASGNYLYVESPPGEPVGAGKTVLLAAPGAAISASTVAPPVYPQGGFLSLTADPGNLNRQFWLQFQTMRSISQLQPGFYDHLMRYDFHNTAFGGLGVYSTGIGCNTSIGWMVLDKVTYTNGRLSAVHGRFEQSCEGATVPLHGEFNWEG